MQEQDLYGRYPSLDGRAVFVTGGGSGIGAAVVTAFAEQGARVAFLDIQRDASEALCDGIAARGLIRPHFEPCDVRDVAALRVTIARAAEAVGEISVLVNNAASDDRHALEAVSPEYWDERMAINQRPYFFAAQAVAKGMRQLGYGAIINLGSIAWKLALVDIALYAMAKASVHGLTRALARELGADGIRVNSVLPGAVMTPRQLEHWIDEARQREVLANQCLKRLLMPEDVARLVLFLGADDSAMCSAQEYTIDGGWV